MSNVLKMLSRGGAAAAETDPNFKQTVLLLHGDGTNGAQNNTFLDGSTNNFTITRNGNTTQGTFSPFSVGAGEWSNYFDGVSENLSVANNAAFQFGTGDFTVEAWVYILAYTDYGVIVKCAADNSWTAGWALTLGTVSVPEIQFFVNGNRAAQASGPSPGSWNHVAVSRSGTSLRIFINGALIQTVTNSGTLVPTTALTIGADITNTNYEFNGYISNVRVVKGTAVYTSNFTPSTTPLTAITNTSLLTCQSNRFVDNSSNAFAITSNGDVRVTPFSPFAPTAAYSAGTNGGSGYFDGTGDFLDVPDNAALEIGANSFCIEAWINPNALPTTGGERYIAAKWISASRSFAFGYVNTSGTMQLRLVYSTTGSTSLNISQSAPIVANAWQHIAVTRDGTTARFFLNGVQQGSTQTLNATFWDSTEVLTIGRFGTGGGSQFDGYLSDLRFVIGSPVYTSNFTPPTAPLTAITNTRFLCNFTNAGIIDNTGKNVLETVGNAQIDTAVKKFGTGSLEFDGTGDYLLLGASTPDLLLGTGPFTLEFWFNTTSSTRYATFTSNETGTFPVGDGFTILINNASSTSGDIAIYRGASGLINSATSVSYRDGNWHHLAFVRDSSGSRLYLNGTQQGSTTASQATTSFDSIYGLRWVIGANLLYTGRDYLGYIDDLRITKGVARYTANFTAPTKEFPDL